MKVISIAVGLPRATPIRGGAPGRDGTIQTGIFKSAVNGPVRVGPEHLEGDAQADLTVHGGVDKAVYAYPSEHYAFWHRELPDVSLAWGAFGENLTIEGLLESDVRAGDRLRIGSARFVVTRPRMPCFKLGIRFGRPDIVKRFWLAARSGFYLAIAGEGVIQAGDTIALDRSDGHGPSMADIFHQTAALVADDR